MIYDHCLNSLNFETYKDRPKNVKLFCWKLEYQETKTKINREAMFGGLRNLDFM